MLVLSGYQVGETLHTTTNSIVYRGQRTADQKAVILKALNKVYPTPLERARFQREYEVTRQLQGTGVIEAIDLLPHQYSLVVVLEDFGALSLKQLMASRALSVDEVLTFALHITEALATVHEKGVMHKDLNPSNIVLNPATGELKLIDFGLATVLSREKPALHNPNHLEGTLPYLSPEQTGRMNRAVDYRTDFYSLGVTLYELLTGQLPFMSSDPLELVHAHIAQQPVPPSSLNSSLPAPLSDIIMKLLAKTAEERYQSAHGLLADLEEVRRQWLATGSAQRFPLGRYDASPRFQLPQLLYGREEEINDLMGAFERVSQGSTELMLVVGHAGVGKTALINELHKPIVERRGYFVAGKFDQFQRTIPYTGLIEAFRELIRQLLTESDAALEQWRARLLDALGSNGQIIIEVVPEVELFIGAQPPVPALGPMESQNRFQFVFRNFIDLFARPEHPLVL
nr:AAA family ATPase [Ardenticatenales bacterium]